MPRSGQSELDSCPLLNLDRQLGIADQARSWLGLGWAQSRGSAVGRVLVTLSRDLPRFVRQGCFGMMDGMGAVGVSMLRGLQKYSLYVDVGIFVGGVLGMASLTTDVVQEDGLVFVSQRWVVICIALAGWMD